jgi:hypothetical protein
MQNYIMAVRIATQSRSKNLLLFRHPCILVLLMLCGVWSSCAEVQPHIQPCLEGSTYGFGGGLWHGIIAPFAWIGSLFNNNIAVWAVNNNGGWYTFGFILGIGALTGGSSKAASK